MVELRRKNKPVPAEIQPPADPEDWIARANADGEPLQAKTVPDKPARRPTTKAKRQQPESQENQERPKQILPSAPSPSTGSRYISFAIDNITLSLFRELSFTLDKGNASTLVHIIDSCTTLADGDFLSFPENRVICGNVKRTMSFLIPGQALENLVLLSKRLRFRNKSALYRYLIQLTALRSGIRPQLI